LYFVGNERYKEDKYERAINLYQSALLLLSELKSVITKVESSIDCFSNSLQAFIRLNQHIKALSIYSLESNLFSQPRKWNLKRRPNFFASWSRKLVESARPLAFSWSWKHSFPRTSTLIYFNNLYGLMSKMSVFFALMTCSSKNFFNYLACIDFIRAVLDRGWRFRKPVQLANIECFDGGTITSKDEYSKKVSVWRCGYDVKK